jgi:23S rRNA (uracil1939-C5)-methyltransferase
MSSSEITALRIEKMVQNGLGFARREGQACLVKYAIAGEVVNARIDARHKQFLETTAVEILEPSRERVEPACPLFYTCGGCHLQHMSYACQLSSKVEALADSLQRIGKFPEPDISAPIASPENLHYRIKTGLKVELRPEPVIGLYQEKSHTLINLERCLLLREQLNEALPLLHAQYSEKPLVKAKVQFIDMLLCSNPETILVHAQSSPGKFRSLELSPRSGRFALCPQGASDTVLDFRFLHTANSFCQVNAAQNEQMIDIVLDFLKAGPGRRILELYCGSGNFSLFLARSGALVFGIEGNRTAVEHARRNAANNGVEGCRFQAADVNQIQLSRLPFKCNSLLLNPPRSGCPARVIRQIYALKPSHIVYVSCNPATLARDLRLLCDGGYHPERIQPLDMFPQTCHIETVVQLVRD